jgi:hypothetical protein
MNEDKVKEAVKMALDYLAKKGIVIFSRYNNNKIQNGRNS